jgi:hypothetical protein
MTRVRQSPLVLIVALACLVGPACRLRRPDVTPVRVIEPQLVESVRHETTATHALPIRLLEPQSRGHIGHRLIRQLPGGELTEDPVWRWSSMPDRYLDTALRLELEARPDLRLVDSGNALVLAVTLLKWQVEPADSPRLVGAIELTVTEADRIVHTHIVRRSEPVSAEMPGDLAAAAGRLLQGLASEGLTKVAAGR